MEDVMWIVIAGLLAVAAGVFLGEGIFLKVQRRNAATTLLMPTRKRALLLQMQNGIGFLRKPATLLLRIKYVHTSAANAVLMLDECGVAITDVSLVSVMLGASLLSASISGLLAHSIAFGIAIGCLAVVLASVYVKRHADEQNIKMRESVPEALRLLATCFRSGSSLVQTLQQASREMKGRIGQLFRIAAQRLEMGATTTEALMVLQSNSQVPELSFIAVALDIQHQSGGSLAPVLESAKDSIESELDLMRSLRVQTAQAKLSASIVTIMPFVLVAFFSLMSPGFLAPFFASPIGIALLAIALVMQVTGVLTVRHMLAIDVR